MLTDVWYKAGCIDGRDDTKQDVLADACVRPGHLTDARVFPGDMQRRAHVRASRHRTVVPAETPNEKDLPLPSEVGTYKTVKAILWLRLSGQSPLNVLSCSLLARGLPKTLPHTTRDMFAAVG